MFMRFEKKSILSIVSILVVACSVVHAGEVFPEEEMDVSFIVPMDSDEGAGDISIGKLKEKILSIGKKDVSPVQLPDIGMGVVTDRFTAQQVKLLEEAGFRSTPPLTVSLFDLAGCRRRPEMLDVTQPQPDPDVPPNVCRVVKSKTPVDAGSTPAVWILDSGIDAAAANGHLTIESRIDCTPSACVENDAVDELGHGTMIAGTIGGMAKESAAAPGNFVGLLGVAPGARLKIIKIFGEEPDTNVLGAPMRGLAYLADHAAPGDIVNLSWGFEWLDSARRRKYAQGIELIDNLLHALADRQVRIVVAAGNSSQENVDFPWSQAYFPASLATYQSAVQPDAGFPAGGIYSVSAVKSAFDEGSKSWTDELWDGGAFGASYSAPGVGVRSYWVSDRLSNPAVKLNTCSGTSFAAPALAGMLVLGGPSETIQPADSPFATADMTASVASGTPSDIAQAHPKCAN